jgi:HK97 family phage prohead protease
MEKQITNIEGQVRELSKDVEETRTVTFIASTSTKDRHGTVVNQKNWNIEKFNANPIIGYQHNVYGGDMCNAPDPDDQLGSAKAYFESVKRGNETEQQLMVDITFEPKEINEKADKIFRKIQHGTLRAVSVGFIPLSDEKGSMGEERDGAFHYFGQELLEVSVVNIPSNPDALKRSLRDSTSNALKFIQKSLNIPFSNIENLKVKDVIKMLEGGEPETKLPEDLNDSETEEKNANVNSAMKLALILKGKKVK